MSCRICERQPSAIGPSVALRDGAPAPVTRTTSRPPIGIGEITTPLETSSCGCENSLKRPMLGRLQTGESEYCGHTEQAEMELWVICGVRTSRCGFPMSFRLNPGSVSSAADDVGRRSCLGTQGRQEEPSAARRPGSTINRGQLLWERFF